MSTLFFIPYFLYERISINCFLHNFLILAIFLTNDRGAILQVIFGLMLLICFNFKLKNSIFLATAFILTCFFVFKFEFYPERFQTIVDIIEFYISNGIAVLYTDFINNDGISRNDGYLYLNEDGYPELYRSVLMGWYNTENLFHILFGSGFGTSDLMISKVAKGGRPHSILLEFIIICGLIPLIFYIYHFIRFLKV